MRRCAGAFVAVLLGNFAGAMAGTTNHWMQFPDDSRLLPGQMVYHRFCAPCHGRSGNGRGEMGISVIPLPRDFRSGIFKFRSTPSGYLPTNEDLYRTIRLGLSGTAMPSFEKMPDRDVRAVAEYIKTFSPRWRKGENFAPAVSIPEVPGWFFEAEELARRAVRGRSLFQTSCAPCHGEQGEGQGSMAAALKDAWNQPILPADLRQTALRSGDQPSDIFRVLSTGLDGTPMPSFAESLTSTQRWEIVAYVQSLQRAHRKNEPSEVVK
jgi:mono/diheme cytochrome c family protein